MMQIIDIKEEDLSVIEMIEKECFTSFWNHEQFVYELHENPFAYLKLIYVDQQIAGYIDYWITFECCQLNKIAIKGACRKKGYAKLLMKKLIEEAENKQCETIMLEVRASNISAQQLYKSFDFIEINRRKGYYTDNGEDAIIMGKALGGNR